MSRKSNLELVPELKRVYADEGLRAALIFLNAQTAQRFTSVFRFDGAMLRCVAFYDREQPEQKSSDEIPVDTSYCIFVRDSGETFKTECSVKDERVRGHPKQYSIQCYCGVPLLDRKGSLYGTICHFDVNPGIIHPFDVDLLERMSRLVQPDLPWRESGAD